MQIHQNTLKIVTLRIDRSISNKNLIQGEHADTQDHPPWHDIPCRAEIGYTRCAVTKFLNIGLSARPTSSVDDTRPLFVLQNFLGFPGAIAGAAVHVHRVAKVAVGKSGHFIRKRGVVLDLEPVRARSMSLVPFELCAHVNDNRTSTVRGWLSGLPCC